MTNVEWKKHFKEIIKLNEKESTKINFKDEFEQKFQPVRREDLAINRPEVRKMQV